MTPLVDSPYRKSLLIPPRQGLSPCKIRRALLGAIAVELSCLGLNADKLSIFTFYVEAEALDAAQWPQVNSSEWVRNFYYVLF